MCGYTDCLGRICFGRVPLLLLVAAHACASYFGLRSPGDALVTKLEKTQAILQWSVLRFQGNQEVGQLPAEFVQCALPFSNKCLAETM